jgi:hypothetical protein
VFSSGGYLGCLWFRVQTELNRQKLASLEQLQNIFELKFRIKVMGKKLHAAPR